MITQIIPSVETEEMRSWIRHYRQESNYWFHDSLANLRRLHATGAELALSLLCNFFLAIVIIAVSFIGLPANLSTKIVLGLCYSTLAVVAFWRLIRLFGK